MPHALLGIAAAAASSSSSVSQVAVYCSAGDTGAPSCSLSEGVLTTDATAAATAVSIYNKTYNATTGFATLDVNALVPDPRLAAFAAGFAEGYQTAFEVAQFWSNVYEFGEDGPSKALTKWVEENDKWTRAQAEEHAASSDYWLSVQTVLDRFDGLHAGYEAAGRAHGVMRHRSAASASAPQQTLPALSRLDLLWINLDGDLFDLQVAIEGEEGVKLGRKGRAVRGFERAGALRDRLARTAAGNGTAVVAAETGPLLRCSALFKLAEDRRELYFGHATWDTYATAAPRIFKHLTLPTRQGDKVVQRTISMSSSPGFLASIDDYYLVAEPTSGTRLGVIETSVDIADHDAYKAITTSSVLCWLRSMVANHLAHDAPTWASTFAEHASGTYNNQWMILDIARAKQAAAAGEPLPSDTFLVAEEVPGLVHSEDQSDHLNTHGYWPSFNEIYYPQTRKIAGAMGDYKEAVRYKLFAEMQGGVNSAVGMARLIAWNDYEHDPIAEGPSQAIMSRGDLYDRGRDDAKQSTLAASRGAARKMAGGGIDAKYSTLTAATDGLVSFGRAGPTNDDQPTFCWTKDFSSTPHVGHPHCFDFEWGPFAPLKNAEE